MARRATADRARYTEELTQLKEESERLRIAKDALARELDEKNASFNSRVDADKEEVNLSSFYPVHLLMACHAS